MTANVSLAHRKHPGFEEISSSRCAQYILKLSGSNSEESYDPIITQTRFSILEQKNVTFSQESLLYGIFKIELYLRKAPPRFRRPPKAAGENFDF